MRSKTKKKPAKKATTRLPRGLASAMKLLRNAMSRARKADPDFDRIYRRVFRKA